MHRHYVDILRRVKDPVLWFDEHAVPRFEPFHPYLLSNIYAVEAVLLRVTCQGCGYAFDVAFSDPRQHQSGSDDPDLGPEPLLADHIRARVLHFGDPPNMECCDAGPSMNSVPRRVLQYWVRPYIMGEGLAPHPHRPGETVIRDAAAMEFRRDPTLEGVDLTPDWAR